MEITRHGALRVFGRTRMVAKDVLELIANDAVVPLGCNKDYEYLLFYSPFDEACKVAIVDRSRTLLISVWETYFHLPKGLAKINHRRETAAAKLQQQYSTSKLVAPATLHQVCIVIYVDGRTAYTHECQTRLPILGHQTEYLDRLRDELTIIVPLVEEYRQRQAGTRIHYLVSLTHPFLPATVRHYRYGHKDMVAHFEAAR